MVKRTKLKSINKKFLDFIIEKFEIEFLWLLYFDDFEFGSL